MITAFEGASADQALVVDRCKQAEAAKAYDVSPGWVSKLVARYRSTTSRSPEPRSPQAHLRLARGYSPNNP